MTAFHLFKELKTHFKVKSNVALAVKLGAQEATLSRLQSHPPKELPAIFLIRCYDSSGFSIERIRELYKQE